MGISEILRKMGRERERIMKYIKKVRMRCGNCGLTIEIRVLKYKDGYYYLELDSPEGICSKDINGRHKWKEVNVNRKPFFRNVIKNFRNIIRKGRNKCQFLKKI